MIGCGGDKGTKSRRAIIRMKEMLQAARVLQKHPVVTLTYPTEETGKERPLKYWFLFDGRAINSTDEE